VNARRERGQPARFKQDAGQIAGEIGGFGAGGL
jgi:hypothetical protein